MTLPGKPDQDMLLAHPPERLLELFFTHIRNIFRVDGLYYLGIEERFGLQAATAIDADCHRALGRIEARRLPGVLGLDEQGLDQLVYALKHSSWHLDLLEKSWQVEPGRAVLTVNNCRTQLARTGKELPVFSCRQVREGYLQAFVEAFNPELSCTCVFCPPDARRGESWCQWVFAS